MRQFGSAAALPAAAGELEPARLRAVLDAHRQQVLDNETLATLRRDVPLGDGPLTSPLSDSALERLLVLFEELEFKSLLPRLQALRGAASPRG